MLDCDKHCNDIQTKRSQIIKQKDEFRQKSNRLTLTPNIVDRANQLDADYEKLSDELTVCIDDCNRRKRDSEFAGSENTYVPPVNKQLIYELAQLDSSDGDDDDDLGGGIISVVVVVVRSEIKQNEHSDYDHDDKSTETKDVTLGV